jgi:tellurium resistance protein TerD
MAINLQKGQRETLNLPQFIIGLGWDTNSAATGSQFDIDASVFVLGENKKMLSDQHFVFYNNLKTPDGAVEHSGDNLTGDATGDDEQIRIDLSKIDAQVVEICVVVTIHDAESRRQNFGQIRNSFVRVFDGSNNIELLKYELDEDFSIETAVEFGRIYKRQNVWKFEAVGAGTRGGLQDFLTKYN